MLYVPPNNARPQRRRQEPYVQSLRRLLAELQKNKRTRQGEIMTDNPVFDNYFDEFFLSLEESSIVKVEFDKGVLATLLRKVYNQGYHNGKIAGIKEATK